MSFRIYKRDELRNTLASAHVHCGEFLKVMDEWVEHGLPVQGEFFIESLGKYLIYQLNKQNDTVVKLSFNSQFPLLREKQEPKISVKIGRNDPCPCGSGKKSKKCCKGAETP